MGMRLGRFMRPWRINRLRLSFCARPSSCAKSSFVYFVSGAEVSISDGLRGYGLASASGRIVGLALVGCCSS
jgi:hypothetical protein